MRKSGSVAFYARVSSEAQARDHTIDSQVAALKERIAADGLQLEPDHGYVDDGWSGTNLQRPALEKLRDAVAGGEIECIYVHAPDRLARRHAHQVLLIEEFRRSGAEIVFLNRAHARTHAAWTCIALSYMVNRTRAKDIAWGMAETARCSPLPGRFSNAGLRSAWIARRCRRPKTCTEADGCSAANSISTRSPYRRGPAAS